MAAKLLHSITDENPDLQKQIGYMTGIFQIFDRNQMIVSGRRISDQSHRRSLPRHSQISNGSLEQEFITAHQRHPAEMNLNKNASERQRFSTESSRASFSSSRSSSFSSVDYCRSTQPDPGYNDRMIFPEAAYGDSQCNISPRLARQSTDFQDGFKDSMVKEGRGLSVKTMNRDLPRDLKLSKDGGKTYGNQRVRDNLKESINVLSKLQGADGQPSEPKEKPRKSDFGYRSNEASHISYGRMETTRFSFNSRETLQTASKLRDLPRLSLDDRECLMYKGDYDSFPNSGLKASLKRSGSTNENGHSLRNVSGSQPRPPSVVAKLMGLETLPDDSSSSRKDVGLIKTGRREEVFDAFKSSAETNFRKPKPESKPPSPKKEPASPRWIQYDMKPVSSSRIAIEPAPWKKQDGNANSLKQPARRIRSPTRQSNPYPSVYSEIEKRWKDIEFNHSGKDLRALKQILEAIHAKGLVEDRKQEQASNIGTIRKQEFTLANQKSASVGLHSARSDSTEVSPGQDNLSRPLGSSIVIMKPISRSPRRQVTKNHAANSDEKLTSTQQITRPQQQPKENTASSPRSGSISPRMRLKKLDSEKKNQAQSLSSDANRARGQVAWQPTESGSPGGRSRPKYNNVSQNRGQISEILIDIKKLRSQGNEASLPPLRTPTPSSKKDREATRTVRSSKLNGSLSPSKKVSRQLDLVSNQSSKTIADEDGLQMKLADISPEHPSPVSVLKTSRHMDDLITEEKWLETAPEDFAEAYTPYKFNLINEPTQTSEISRRKLQTVDNLVQKLKRLNSTHDESRRDYIALLCDNTNPDHWYISEILLASGLLLQEFGSKASPFQLHPSGNLFNPELFDVLEQTKSSTHLSKGNQYLDEGITAKDVQSKSHRKLIFDSVNEILIKKLSVSGNLTDYKMKLVHKHSAIKKAFNAQNLIKDICTEMEQYQPKKKKEFGHNSKDEELENDVFLKDLLSEDVMQRSESWTKFEGGIPEVVLDIERLLFKDLVNEIVVSEAVACRPRRKSGSPGKRFLK